MPEKKIKKDMMLGDLVDNYPQAAMLMAQKGMHCIGCGMAAAETIEQGCIAHGMTKEDINKLLEEMNEIADKSEKDKKGE
jgi:hydroxylamine reductase